MNLQRLEELAEQAFYHEKVDEAGGLFPPSKYYNFFRLVNKEYQFKNAVVLGVCGGGDCYHLCLGNPEGHVVGVDVVYDHPEQMEYIKAHCLGFRFWKGDSVESARVISDNFGPVNFLFIDTVHTEDDTIKEYEAWKLFMAPGCLVCFDDLFRPGMQEAWDKIPEPKMRLDYLHDGTYPHGGGFGVHIHG